MPECLLGIVFGMAAVCIFFLLYQNHYQFYS